MGDKGGIGWPQLEACRSSAWRLSLSQHTWSVYSCSCTSIAYKTTQTGELKHLATCCKFSNQVEEVLEGWLVCGIHRTYSSICWWRQLRPEIAEGMDAAERTTQHLKRPDSSVEQVVKANGVQIEKLCHSMEGSRPVMRSGTAPTQDTSLGHGFPGRDCTPFSPMWPDQQPNHSKDSEDSDCWSDHTEGVDTGAALSLITEQQQQELFPSAMPQHSDVTFRTYTAECLPMVGEMKVHVQ